MKLLLLSRGDDEYCLIVEDDLELSPFWYVWLKKAWKNYRQRDDIAGITLSRQYMMVKKPDHNVEIVNEHRPFLYKLVGTWAFAPHPRHWREFLDWFNSLDSDAFDPYVRGLATSDWLHQHTAQGRRHMTWEQWHVYYCQHHGQFTLYLNLPDRMTMAANWMEHGVHTRGSARKRDFPLLDYCAIQLQASVIWVFSREHIYSCTFPFNQQLNTFVPHNSLRLILNI